MKPVWFILWAVVIWQVASWAFAPPPPSVQMEASRDVPRDVEEVSTGGRELVRQQALAALDKPWSSRCGADRRDFLSGLAAYYYNRQNQTERYPEIYGKAGAEHIARQWSTSDDSRIDRLTREAYGRGYLRPSDFNGPASKLVAAIVQNERVTGKGCSG